MSLKLLAIRPLEKCGSKFLKNLGLNVIYKFYDNYAFLNSGKRIDLPGVIAYKEVDEIAETGKPLPGDFFSPMINLSAIVGKNGSGKSSIMDLFIAAINQVSLKLKSDDKLNTTAELQSTSTEKNSVVHCEIFYEIDNAFFQIVVDDNEFFFKSFSDNKGFELSNFFYSEIISYSVYAFNAWEIGDWVDALFHKNDSYQIPIVINPKREGKKDRLAGIIDVNNEAYLLQQRLVSIILSNHDLKITENLSAKYLKLDLKEAKHFFVLGKNQVGREYENEDDIRNDFHQILKSDYGINFHMKNSDSPSTLYKNLDFVLDEFKLKYGIKNIIIPDLQHKIDLYILYKIISICEKYVSYRSFIIPANKEKQPRNYTIDIEAFLNKIEDSQSHIIFKLKQTINFIRYYEEIWSQYIKEGLLSIPNLSKALKSKSDKNVPLIELLPPPIFETKLISSNKIDLLDRISSGEKQLIHSVSTIIYHLTNIDSVEKDDLLIKYNYVNLILDEIELYFHPQFQKQFINRLIDEISKINFKNIKGINILVISHSPFILSDIPKQNVLFLDGGKPVSSEKFENTNTFAANISDLLSDSFFIGDGLIGEYAVKKINKTIEWLNLVRAEQLKQEKSEENKFNELTSIKVVDSHKKIIDIIDEPIVKKKLVEMFSEVFGNEERKKYLLSQKREIEQQLKDLEV